MFTGIVEACPAVAGVEPLGSGSRLRVPAPGPDWAVAEGESVCVAGVCLTVAWLEDEGGARVESGRPGATMVFELSKETLDRSWLGEATVGRRVNLERSLRMGDRLSGHIVQGHVDGKGRVVAVEDSGDGGKRFSFEVDPGLERYLIEKGSVSLDGISLTVCEPRGRRFDVAIIPVTLEVTSLGSAEVGTPVNVEADVVGKWIEHLVPGPSRAD